MDSEQNWAEALNINPEKLGEWSALAPEGTPLLVWCLEQGHVPLQQYLQWASAHFGLPVLNSEFFLGHFDRTALDQARGRDPWSAWCFPVGQWEDVTIVACVEPPREKPEGNFAFVLADPQALDDVWSGQTITSSREESDGEDDEEKEPEEAPMGIDLNVKKTFTLNFDGLALAPDHATASQPAIAIPEEEEIVESSMPPPAPAPVVRAKTAIVTLVPEVAVPNPAPKKATKAVATGGAEEEAEMTAAFEKLKDDYQFSLVMRCTETAATPYKWDRSVAFAPQGEKASIDLSKPSFFRIVAKTLLPYHGYVVDSPTHREFFASLGIAEPPTCITAIPLKADSTLWGILVAIGNEKTQGPESLQNVQKVADKLTAALESNWLKSAA